MAPTAAGIGVNGGSVSSGENNQYLALAA